MTIDYPKTKRHYGIYYTRVCTACPCAVLPDPILIDEVQKEPKLLLDIVYSSHRMDLVKDRGLVKKALPVAVVLTICATGSEMNSGAVISNEKTHEKLEINHPLLYPVLSICDPTYLYTLPSKQTAAGAVDILSHVMEQYFQPNDEAYITDVLSEAVMKTVIKYARKAMDEPENYEARSNLMWSSTVALNHLLTVGKGGAWSVHPIEHVISAYYDITHGVGLAVLTPAWMSYVLSDTTAPRFARQILCQAVSVFSL